MAIKNFKDFGVGLQLQLDQDRMAGKSEMGASNPSRRYHLANLIFFLWSDYIDLENPTNSATNLRKRPLIFPFTNRL